MTYVQIGKIAGSAKSSRPKTLPLINTDHIDQKKTGGEYATRVGSQGVGRKFPGKARSKGEHDRRGLRLFESAFMGINKHCYMLEFE
jgi:hypothetical protein